MLGRHVIVKHVKCLERTYAAGSGMMMKQIYGSINLILHPNSDGIVMCG